MTKETIGKKYWRLTVKEVYQKPSGTRNRKYAKCICDCGKEHKARFDWLKNWSIRSCGCVHQTYLDEIWKKYRGLTITDVHTKRSRSSWKMITYAICSCVCGNVDVHVQLPNLKNGGTKSCGCSRSAKTLWLTSKSRQYGIWYRMYKSCTNPDHTSYPRRGGQWIWIIPEWHSFAGRWEDNHEQYDEFAYFTRINPFKDFTKENCVRRIAYNISKFDLFNK